MTNLALPSDDINKLRVILNKKKYTSLWYWLSFDNSTALQLY